MLIPEFLTNEQEEGVLKTTPGIRYIFLPSPANDLAVSFMAYFYAISNLMANKSKKNVKSIKIKIYNSKEKRANF
jgi:hypothetical protein